MKQLYLYIDGILTEIRGVNMVAKNCVEESMLLNKAVAYLKHQYRLEQDGNWQIYLICKSEME